MSIFVSYSQQDDALYTSFCLTLDQAKIRRWDPKRMAIGESLADQLRKAIRACHTCVFLATKRSISSPWCMAELGAFWGAGKRVIILLADPGIKKAQLPPQFQGDLSTKDARKILDTIKDPSAAVSDEILTPDLVLLLRYLKRDKLWIPQDLYGKAMAVANGVAANAKRDQLRGWRRAVRYGLLYLAHLGLTQKNAETEITYKISEYGLDVLNSPRIRQRFKKMFAEKLLPLKEMISRTNAR